MKIIPILCTSALLFLLYSCSSLQKMQTVNREQVVLADSVPEGYRPVYFKKRKHIADLNQISDYASQVTRVESDSGEVRIFFHLMDTSGTFLAKALDEKWKDIWCGITVEYINKKKPLKKYILQEQSIYDHNRAAIALVLDHSGSMGSSRAKIVQDAAKDFYTSVRRKSDAIAIVKYDDNAVLEVPLTRSQKVLDATFKRNGLRGYGLNTALIDAVSVGLSQLAKSRGYTKKAVILYTDGLDNCSKTPLDSILMIAKKNNIIISTIDFGHGVAEGFLRFLSDATGGQYHHIYSTQEFNYIFQDFYQRLNNSYVLSFKPEYYGIHKITLELCLPQGKMKLSTIFDNSIPGIWQDSLALATAYDVPEDTLVKATLHGMSPTEYLPNSGSSTLPATNILPGTIIPLDVHFDHDKSVLKTESTEAIETALELLEEYPLMHIELAGHTDSTGSKRRNRHLSQHRAEAVKKELCNRGISPERISTIGYGAKFPIADNRTEAGRAKNRRTEIKIISIE